MSKPKPIRRADGTEIVKTEDSDEALMERVMDQLTRGDAQPKEKKKSQVVVQTDERQTVRSFVRIDKEAEESIGPTWETLKEDVIKQLQGKIDKRVYSEDFGDINVNKYPVEGRPYDEGPGIVRRV